MEVSSLPSIDDLLYANFYSLDPDEAQRNIGPGLDPK